MLKNRLIVEQDSFNTATKVADLIVELYNKKLEKTNYFNIAISGGSTPNILFKLLAERYNKTIDWSKFKIFWVDERCVDPTDNESNYGTVKQILIDNIDIPAENIFRMRGEADPSEEAKRYEAELLKHLPLIDEIPQFDLVLLGMGDDGHTASIFPDQMELLQSIELVKTAKHPTTGQNRITLTGKLICNAAHLAFVITGKSKSKVVDEVIHEKDWFEHYPAYYIMSDCKADIYLDEEAASLL